MLVRIIPWKKICKKCTINDFLTLNLSYTTKEHEITIKTENNRMHFSILEENPSRSNSEITYNICTFFQFRWIWKRSLPIPQAISIQSEETTHVTATFQKRHGLGRYFAHDMWWWWRCYMMQEKRTRQNKSDFPKYREYHGKREIVILITVHANPSN